MGNFQFISTRNYMKKDIASSGTSSLAGPSVSFYFGNGYKSTLTIPHNLGYVPLFRVYYEPYRDGRVMEAFQDNAWYLPETPNATRINAIAPTLMAWADQINLYVVLYFTDSTLSAYNFPIYHTVYKDYGVNA